MTLRVTILMGGWGAERAVSLVSAQGIIAACQTLGHHVTPLDMGETPADGTTLAARLTATTPDVIFNALHGTPGEDGVVQGLLDLLRIPYTHSGVTASAIAIDKQLTKAVLAPHGVRAPAGRIIESAGLHHADPLPRPYVLKPFNEGSSVGVAIVTDHSNHGSPIGRDVAGPWQHYATLLAETYIAGRELTVTVLGSGEKARALCVTELRPVSGFYDYDAKYTDGLTIHICPADIPASIAAAACEMSLTAHRVLGCRGVSRSDYRWDESRDDAGLYFIEINTQPGMTPLSLVPEQAKALGIDYPTLVQLLLDDALEAAHVRP
ncbi:D-alanine--D-alanine ligase [Sandaracinobacteroides saxicola]|uniref:D-alanine--D-alanine ligase n=1 Tax=Sandaracinobacteroides saxicola TaxID=2759707 RepID=A0A7G5IG81_9SPHN|nr:D-alanine--D-alanine ligase [Sandaracinobacteroides saxicola]QMW22373.1 D-alanine--D-alanine ligase [Sandaracinobacteroides saxicola]